MSRLLTQIDPHLPPLSTSSTPSTSPSDLSSSSTQSMLPSPSKDSATKPDSSRMKEWIFPRQSSQNSHSHDIVEIPSSTSSSSTSSHGRSNSIAKKGQGHHESRMTKDLRHRSNFSLIHPGTPELSVSPTSSPSSSKRAHNPTPSAIGPNHLGRVGATTGGGGGGTWWANKRINDLLYFFVFGGSFLFFFSSLFGIGYKEPLSISSNEPTRMRESEAVRNAAVLENVEIAKGFMEEGEGIPADVYQSIGDTSHDEGHEFVRTSPDDPDLDDERVHVTYHPPADSALFPHVSDPSELDSPEFHEIHEENRPRPARLPSTHDHDGHEEHELLEEEEDDDDDDEEDADDDEHATEGGGGSHDHYSSQEDNDIDVLVDDSISIESHPPSHLTDSDSTDDAEDSLTALEELLLDASEDEEASLTPEEEEAQHLALQHRRPIVTATDPEGEGRVDALERLRKEREELGRMRKEWEERMRAGLTDEDDEEQEEEIREEQEGERELRERRIRKRSLRSIR
ncbi:uncharacterized protein JCM6883_006263 [Sporobolomyces salmoneus]|uniref:uncharacterized protein n=1 Tax=Sporobolomyces salmoneus TaxID=183962 RepID=UPI0031723269